MNENKWKFSWLGCDLYVCYDVCVLLPQIMDNLKGHKGTLFNPLSQPSTAALGLLRTLQKERDIPLAAATQSSWFDHITAL